MAESLYIDLSPTELQKRNIMLKRDREAGFTSEVFAEKLIPELRNDQTIRAVIVCFSDLEGKLHLLDYNKDFFLTALDNLTFDGSSIKGFSEQHESDLRLFIDWTSFRWLPAHIFGSGKVLVFAGVANQDGTDYESDMRAMLAQLLKTLKEEKNLKVLAAPETEGFLIKGMDAEQNYAENVPFELATKGGYFSALPHDDLRVFIDQFAQAKLMLGFENEKDHPEVAPSQFELNYKYTEALGAADQILLYKIVARQVAKSMGYTACFLPKPAVGINGSGMHTNMSIAQEGKNLFYDAADHDKLSKMGRSFVAGILTYGKELCLSICSSVNAYRRLDPHYEAPNEIKMSAKDRGSMVRIPVGNEKSARIEVRSVAPDSNPYLVLFTLIKAGLTGMEKQMKVPSGEVQKLPGSIQESIEYFEKSEFMKSILGDNVHRKYLQLKQMVADRSPRELGSHVKKGEVVFHHEIRNQSLWSQF
jgi:glutamine synthetase